MSVQSIVAQVIDAFFISIIFAKMTNPKLRTQTILFSRNAVVCVHDGALSMIFRVGDMRKNPLIGANIRAELIKTKKTKEGELLRHYKQEINITADECGNDVFFLWPANIVHKIDEDSPFYHYSARDLLQQKFEIVLILDGTVESTGQSIQAKSSYVSGEILWGYKFEHVVDHLKREDSFDVDYGKFDNVYPVDTPLCSAAQYEEYLRNNNDQPLESARLATVTTDSFDDDDDDDDEEEMIRVPPPPPPPVQRSKSQSKSYIRRSSRRPSQDEEHLLEFASSYV